MSGPQPCTGVCFSVVESARLYSQLMGVLTGFTFAIIVLLVDRAHRPPSAKNPDGAKRRSANDVKRRNLENVLVVFVVAFIGAIEGTFLYATVGGEAVNSRRVLLKNLNALVEGINVFLTIIYALVWLLRTLDLRRATQRAAQIARTVVPVIVMIYATVNASYFVSAPHSVSAQWTWWNLAVLVLVFVVAMALRPRNLVSGIAKRWNSWRDKVEKSEPTHLYTKLIRASARTLLRRSCVKRWQKWAEAIADWNPKHWYTKRVRQAATTLVRKSYRPGTSAVTGAAVASIVGAAVVAGVNQYVTPEWWPWPWLGLVGLLLVGASVLIYAEALRRIEAEVPA